MPATDTVLAYLKDIKTSFKGDIATEHTYRPALKKLLDSLSPQLVAVNEPQHVLAGAPDLVVTYRRGNLPVGYVETKKPGENLSEIEKSEQLRRYRKHLENLILTDYLEFRWYVDGELRGSARLGLVSGGKMLEEKSGAEGVLTLLAAFIEHEGIKVGSPRELAERMARLAHFIRDRAITIFSTEGEKGPLHGQFEAFRKELLHDLTPDRFADMYAQTLAYGLFSARATSPSAEFARNTAWTHLPKTNPFLRDFFYQVSGPNLDDRLTPFVDDLVGLLGRADMSAILADFGKRARQEDPVVHFYETFLAAYDPAMRERRGVYYTPEPVVSYIVRSVDWLLRTRFDKPKGLADENVYVLDPATGTGTFLYFVIRQIYDYLQETGQLGSWNSYVADHLLPRLFGFELLMAPYAVAHLKLGLELQELGYEFKGDERLGVFLTNTLEEAHEVSDNLYEQWLAREVAAANDVKASKPIMVILGNPPYSVTSYNTGEWITGLLKSAYYQVDGHPLGEANPKVLLDDYVKFIRYAEDRLRKTGYGILAFITNHGWLDNPTFRGMRQHLLNSFSEVFVLNLHGNSKKKEVCPDGSPDENVFDIQQGVAISLFVKQPGAPRPAKVYYADLWGERESKYVQLYASEAYSTEWVALTPKTPLYLMQPLDYTLEQEYVQVPSIEAVFDVTSTGIKTHRDDFVFDFDRTALEKRISTFLDPVFSDDEVAQRLGLKDTGSWSLKTARESLKDQDWEASIQQALYRPFDVRWLVFRSELIDRPRPEVMRHLLAVPNLALVTHRSTRLRDITSFYCTRHIMETKCGESTIQSYVFPLYLYPTETKKKLLDEGHEWEAGKDGRRPNLDFKLIQDWSQRLGRPFRPEPAFEQDADQLVAARDWFGPEDVFGYLYAVLHSPTYRERYRDFLKLDFPRVPLTGDWELFCQLAALGNQLVALHLLEAPEVKDPANWITTFPTGGDNVVEKGFPKWHESTGRVQINKQQAFEGVPKAVWEFMVGGYQVAEKWLKDRRGRALSHQDIEHYQQVLLALSRTIELMAAIDAAIPGWPLE